MKISVKASNVPLMIEAYRQLAEVTDHPLHLGVTEAGPPPAGLIKGTAGIATLLAEGIGDTIRYSLTADPVEEARAGRQLLEAMGLRERKNVDLIACPSCGRAEIDVIKVAKDAQAALEAENLPIQVAVMGCVVNGPGEARDADLGIAAGRKKGHLFVKGKVVRVVPEDEMVDALVDEAERIVAEGIEARSGGGRRRRRGRGGGRPPGPARRAGRRRQRQRPEGGAHPQNDGRRAAGTVRPAGMPEYLLRPVVDEEFPAFARAVEAAFGDQPDEEDIAGWRSVTEFDRTIAVFDGDEIVANAGAFTFDLTLPCRAGTDDPGRPGSPPSACAPIGAAGACSRA